MTSVCVAEKLLAIIPARGGSKRIVGKNTREFLGREIISYPIQELMKVPSIGDVLVSTDSVEIKKVAEKYGASVPMMRSDQNSGDYATTFDVIKEVLDKTGYNGKYACCIYPTSVAVNASMIEEAINLLEGDDDADSIASVLEYGHPIQRSFRLEEGVIVFNSIDNYSVRTQDLDKNYHDAGQFYIFNVEAVLSAGRLMGDKCLPYELDARYVQDIDTISDWELAELKYKAMVSK